MTARLLIPSQGDLGSDFSHFKPSVCVQISVDQIYTLRCGNRAIYVLTRQSATRLRSHFWSIKFLRKENLGLLNLPTKNVVLAGIILDQCVTVYNIVLRRDPGLNPSLPPSLGRGWGLFLSILFIMALSTSCTQVPRQPVTHPIFYNFLELCQNLVLIKTSKYVVWQFAIFFFFF